MTVERLERGGSHAIGGNELAALIRNKAVTYTRIDTGSEETVVYGRRRVGPDGKAADYEIGDSGIIETVGEDERAIAFYRYMGRGYACIDLKCPYSFVVKAAGHSTPPTTAKGQK